MERAKTKAKKHAKNVPPAAGDVTARTLDIWHEQVNSFKESVYPKWRFGFHEALPNLGDPGGSGRAFSLFAVQLEADLKRVVLRCVRTPQGCLFSKFIRDL